MNTPTPDKALPQGATLGAWVIDAVLGGGAAGIVYRARDSRTGEAVAIREYFPAALADRHDSAMVMAADPAADALYKTGLRKFITDANILSALSHPNIVKVRCVFEIDGTACMVMDFESGTSLAQLLAGGRRFDEAGLLVLLRPIAAGLELVHGGGVLHRDIRPENILIDESGRAVLIDFGSDRPQPELAAGVRATLYTPPYAAIEQYGKTHTDGPWTDIYAIGVTLRQCVTGAPPPDVLTRLQSDDDDHLSARDWPGFSRTFTAAVDAAMGIRPLERPQSLSVWLKQFEPRIAPPAPTPVAAPAIETPAAAPVAPIVVPVAAAVVAPIPVAPVAPAPVFIPAAPTPVIAPTPVAARVAAPAAPEKPHPMHEPPPHTSRHGFLWLLIIVIVLAGAGYAGRAYLPPSLQQHLPTALPQQWLARLQSYLPAPGKSAPAASVAPSGAAPAGPAMAAAKPVAPPTPKADAAALLADAQRLNRPPKEIAALTDANGKIAALTADKAGIDQMNALALDMARTEASALDRAAKPLSRDLQPGASAAVDANAAVTAFNQAKSKLDAAIAAVPPATDAIASLQAARQALAAYDAFATAYRAAADAYIPVRRAALAALDISARGVAQKIATLAKGDAPWLLASRARKAAYQTLKDDAAQAQTQITQIDRLNQSAASAKELKPVSAALSQATTVKTRLDGLLAKSTAAYPIYNQ